MAYMVMRAVEIINFFFFPGTFILCSVMFFHIPDMKNIRGKAGLFGGKFSFNYDRKEYKFKLPAKAEKFVDFFVK